MRIKIHTTAHSIQLKLLELKNLPTWVDGKIRKSRYFSLAPWRRRHNTPRTPSTAVCAMVGGAVASCVWRGTLSVGRTGRYDAGYSGHDQRGRRELGRGHARRGEGATMSRRDTGRGSYSEECNEPANRARHWSLAGRLAKRPIA